MDVREEAAATGARRSGLRPGASSPVHVCRKYLRLYCARHVAGLFAGNVAGIEPGVLGTATSGVLADCVGAAGANGGVTTGQPTAARTLQGVGSSAGLSG